MIFRIFLFLLPVFCFANNVKKSELRNPRSWPELKAFLKDDQTDAKEYRTGIFNCQGFAIEIRDNARDGEWRCAYVTVSFEGKSTGHALNAFVVDTREHVYVDSGGEDSVAYVKIGKPYGLISIDSVHQQETIGCDDVDHFRGSIFSYDYFEAHERCRSFLTQEWDLYNAQVNDYNARLESRHDRRSYLRQELERVHEQQKSEQEQLAHCRANLVLTDAQEVESYNKRIDAFNLANEEYGKRVDEFNTGNDEEKMVLDEESSRLKRRKEELSKLQKALGPTRLIEGTVSEIQEYW